LFPALVLTINTGNKIDNLRGHSLCNSYMLVSILASQCFGTNNSLCVYIEVCYNKLAFAKHKFWVQNSSKTDKFFYNTTCMLKNGITRYTICRVICGMVGFVLFTIKAEAQQGSVSGYIKESKTNTPLPGANVFIKINGAVFGNKSDSNGRFIIRHVPAGNHVLQATFIGYVGVAQNISVAPDSIVRINIILNKETSLLNEVSIAAPTEATQIRESPFAVSVIEGRKLAGRGLTIDDAISRVTGVQVRRSGGIGSASRFNIRGLEGQRVQIFIDGNAADVAGNALSLDDIPIQLVERVEVYKGVVPAHFGGDGLGGAINIVTRHLEEGYLDAGLTVGSFGQKQFAFTGQRPFEHLKIGITLNIDDARNNYSMDNPFRPGLRVERDHDAFKRVVAGVEVSTDRLGFDEVKVEGAIIASEQQIQGVQSNFQHASVKSRFSSLLLQAESEGLKNGKLDTKLGFLIAHTLGELTDTSRFRYDWERNRFPSPGGRGELGFLPANSENRTFFARQRSTLTFRPGVRRDGEYIHTVNATSVLDFTRFRPNDSLANAYAGRNVSNYPGNQVSAIIGLSHEWRLGEKQQITNIVGLRGYYMRSSGTPSNLLNPSTTTPPETNNTMQDIGISEAFRIRITPTTLLKASAELARRLPTSTELFGDGLLVFASSALRAEKSFNLSTGFQYTKDLSRNRQFRAEVTGFYMRVQDLIRLGGGVAGAAYTNVGKARIAGVETEMHMDVFPWLYAKSYLTWQDVRDVLRYEPGTQAPSPTYGLRIPNIPYFFGGTTLDFYKDGLFLRQTRSRFFYEGIFTEEYFYAYQISRLQERKIPQAITHTIGIEQVWLRSGISLSAEIQNLTNARVLNILNNPLPGRSVRCKLRYTWISKKER